PGPLGVAVERAQPEQRDREPAEEPRSLPAAREPIDLEALAHGIVTNIGRWRDLGHDVARPAHQRTELPHRVRFLIRTGRRTRRRHRRTECLMNADAVNSSFGISLAAEPRSSPNGAFQAPRPYVKTPRAIAFAVTSLACAERRRRDGRGRAGAEEVFWSP